jgi:predicted nucleic acid-binding protein
VTVVLDSWAILRYLEDAGPTASMVADLLEHERPIVSWINLGEVFYVVRRVQGEDAASQTVRDLRQVIVPEVPSPARVIEAARIKAEHPMADADAFASATAVAHRAVLWTGDPELLVEAAAWQRRDLRR